MQNGGRDTTTSELLKKLVSVTETKRITEAKNIAKIAKETNYRKANVRKESCDPYVIIHLLSMESVETKSDRNEIQEYLKHSNPESQRKDLERALEYMSYCLFDRPINLKKFNSLFAYYSALEYLKSLDRIHPNELPELTELTHRILFNLDNPDQNVNTIRGRELTDKYYERLGLSGSLSVIHATPSATQKEELLIEAAKAISRLENIQSRRLTI